MENRSKRVKVAANATPSYTIRNTLVFLCISLNNTPRGPQKFLVEVCVGVAHSRILCSCHCFIGG